MKKIVVSVTTLIIFVLLGIVPQAIAAESNLKTAEQQKSYMLGNLSCKEVKDEGLVGDKEAFIKAIGDTLSGNKLDMTQDELTQAFILFQAEWATKRSERKQKEAEVNRKEGETFLAENAKKPGVKTLSDGLQYLVLTEGKGESPSSQDAVMLHYIGMLTNGDSFDKSHNRGSPAVFAVADVIPGWEQALKLMKPGAKWKVFIPPQLAYGWKGLDDRVGPNATVVYELELFSVLKPQK